ncbi:hypothetical protein IG631_12308 [Alternaria alternata]|nr:hypothetical protein IG631_12308 [Alternaria alternata]
MSMRTQALPRYRKERTTLLISYRVGCSECVPLLRTHLGGKEQCGTHWLQYAAIASEGCVVRLCSTFAFHHSTTGDQADYANR